MKNFFGRCLTSVLVMCTVSGGAALAADDSANETVAKLRAMAARYAESSYQFRKNVSEEPGGPKGNRSRTGLFIGDIEGTIALSGRRFDAHYTSNGDFSERTVFDGNQTMIWRDPMPGRDLYDGDPWRAKEIMTNPLRPFIVGTESLDGSGPVLPDVVAALMKSATGEPTTSTLFDQPATVLRYANQDEFCEVDPATKRLVAWGRFMRGGVLSSRKEVEYEPSAADGADVVKRLRRTSYTRGGEILIRQDTQVVWAVFGRDAVAAVSDFSTEAPAGVRVRKREPDLPIRVNANRAARGMAEAVTTQSKAMLDAGANVTNALGGAFAR